MLGFRFWIIIYFLGHLSWSLAFGPGIWKKYHNNQKIFFWSYYTSTNKSIYDTKLSDNLQIRNIEKQIIQKDHLSSQFFTLFIFVIYPLMILKRKYEFEREIKNYYKIIDFIPFVLIVSCYLLFVYLPNNKLLKAKILLEEQLESKQNIKNNSLTAK
ncbi:MAG: hypothetical protein ACQBVK_00915 [Candidatus Phytoplasma sp. TWB_XP]